MTTQMTLAGIQLYPVKSCGGLRVSSISIDRFGPRGDRRWMVVDAQGRFISQREQPAMCRVDLAQDEDGISLACDGSKLSVPVPTAAAPHRRVQIWNDRVSARDAGDAAADWFSEVLQTQCRLVYMPDDSVRRVDGVYASGGETVGFADGFPLLLISQASLDDLNSRLPKPVPMNRFRPNLVVTGCEPYAEDSWHRIRIGAMEFEVAKPCSRCVMPSIIQETGARDPAINRVLASYRRIDGQVMFGQNLLYQHCGQLIMGDQLELIP